jgi:hypothetical protein
LIEIKRVKALSSGNQSVDPFPGIRIIRIHPWVPTVWWEGEGELCKPPPPPLPPHNTAARIPTYLNTITQQSYNTRVHKITNVPVAIWHLYLMVLRHGTSLLGEFGKGWP